ncbi:Lipase_GDSL domain-containing protein [Cephalotus follicularis]|uniref:Lipase_GDSL domain-containing protein n=1 Tax=Cephalotus follicularis TaxID=3775 RepID=A0A1Q3D3D5_CEPFO|nr:Lipase_GDSL domain-containing protein [Cephalotus follicularis]
MARMALLAVLALALTPMLSWALDIRLVRQWAVKYNVSSVLVFGDSSVDPGNNNYLSTTVKGDFLPYGKDFFDGRPTGRFSNGRLATDLIAAALGHTKTIPAFLDRNLKPTDLLHGVSFASAASGYDDLTANLSKVMPVSKQLDYFRHYKMRVIKLVGAKKAAEIIRDAIVVLSMGTNDFIQNYFLEPIRPKQFTLEEYMNYLISRMSNNIMVMHSLGLTRLAVVGVPPLGCMPIVRTLMGEGKCVKKLNLYSSLFNSKIQKELATLKTTLGMKSSYVDAYGIILDAVNHPQRYGLTVTSKGCCGTGTIEYGPTCKGMRTCADASKYVFFDAVHPTQKMYQIIAVEAIKSIDKSLA